MNDPSKLSDADRAQLRNPLNTRSTLRAGDKALRIIDVQAADIKRLRAENKCEQEHTNSYMRLLHAAESRLADATALLRETYSQLQLKGTWLGARYDAFLAAAPAQPTAPLTPFGAHDDLIERQPAATARTEDEPLEFDDAVERLKAVALAHGWELKSWGLTRV
jgi:hypothetical protein